MDGARGTEEEVEPSGMSLVNALIISTYLKLWSTCCKCHDLLLKNLLRFLYRVHCQYCSATKAVFIRLNTIVVIR